MLRVPEEVCHSKALVGETDEELPATEDETGADGPEVKLDPTALDDVATDVLSVAGEEEAEKISVEEVAATELE